MFSDDKKRANTERTGQQRIRSAEKPLPGEVKKICSLLNLYRNLRNGGIDTPERGLNPILATLNWQHSIDMGMTMLASG